MGRPKITKPDIDEHGAPYPSGKPQVFKKRLFMQMLCFGGCEATMDLITALKQSQIPAVLYEDVNDPHGVGLLTWNEDPDHFIMNVRSLLNAAPFSGLTLKPEYTMFGRTYALGHEPKLKHWLFEKPVATATNPKWPWAVWYPLRRAGAFQQLNEADQRRILMEHAKIGMSFAEGGYANDIRLACHGLDTHDNDFVIGLTGKDLYPLSAIVERMRKTEQTSQYLQSLGPFFIGKVAWQAEV